MSTSPSFLFARGVVARLSIWPVLKIAVEQGWGGPESAAKKTMLASAIVDAFEEESTLPDDQYVEEMLLQVLADEFDTVIEDQSGEPVAKDIVKLWDDAQSGRVSVIEKLEEQAEKAKGKKIAVEEKIASDGEEWSDEDSDEDEEEDEQVPTLIPHQHQPKPEPEIDEDGFQTVIKGKGH